MAPLPKRTRKAPEKAFQPAVDKHIKVHQEVWKTAQQLLAGSYTKIEVVDETTVVVR